MDRFIPPIIFRVRHQDKSYSPSFVLIILITNLVYLGFVEKRVKCIDNSSADILGLLALAALSSSYAQTSFIIRT